MQEDQMLQFRIEGPHAEAMAAEINGILESELAVRATSRSESSLARKEVYRGADPLAVTALILAVPSALLAAADLAQRLEIKSMVDRLLRRIRDRAAEHPRHRVEVIDAEGRGNPVDELRSDELLEISVELSVRVRRRADR